MSSRPSEQALEPGIREIQRGMDVFTAAAHERVRCCGEWNPDHIRELLEITKQMGELRLRLTALQTQTW